MKTELRPGIFIEGFDDVALWNRKLCYLGQVSEKDVELLYQGKTSEIPEELAKECVELLAETSYGNFYRNYQYNKPQPVSFTKCTAKESIQSACNQEYCIIYKTK